MNNELIINLARKAGFDSHDMSDDFTCNLENILEFANLMVQECIDIMQDFVFECDGDLDFAIWLAKRHFGVKEDE